MVVEYAPDRYLATLMIIFHDPTCLEYSKPGHPERPERIARTAPVLKDRHPEWEWRSPRKATDDELRAHSRQHIERVTHGWEDFDLDTPFYPNIEMYARQSAGGAIEAARAALRGQSAFSLMRPPGHHATHGNGTEAILADNRRIQFVSIHQFPAYPGTGARSFANIDNYPVAPFTLRTEHVDVAKHSLEKLLTFKPDLLLVSAGFDAYARDPLLQLTLEREDFAKFGEWLSNIDHPVAVVLEGGYSEDLPELIDAFLTSWND